MVTAIVLITADLNRIDEIVEALLALDGVAEVYSLAGDYDLAAILRVRHYDQIAELVPGHLAKINGIERTQTMMAFKCYSRRDLEQMWEIGLEETRRTATGSQG